MFSNLCNRRVWAIGASLLYPTKIVCDSAPESEEKFIALFLSPKSQEQLKGYLAERGHKNSTGREVVVRRVVNPNDSFTYQPLFGERGAFRLKGIVESDGALAATGTVSILSGPLVDDDYVSSMPIRKEGSDESKVVASMDLPSLVQKVPSINEKMFWKGRVPAGSVLGVKHPAAKGSSVTYPFERQIVLEGRICSDKYVDENGNCNFDRSVLLIKPAEDKSSAATAASKASSTSNSDSNSSGDETVDVGVDDDGSETVECPICKYMKAGPCKDQFLKWDECMNSLAEGEDSTRCYSVTIDMMRCMKSYEYYDIMTAGTEKLMVDAEAENSKTST